MSIVSYSQNQEDVLLSLALGDVTLGFYIDIGASHPEIDSVTKHFYDLGWHGINVEPEHEAFELFVKSRQRDLNFNLAIGEINSEVPFYVSSIRGRHSLIRENAEYMGETTNKTLIKQRNLTNLLDEVVPPISTIHFLKIDVEGFEKEVLKALDFNRYRPWIILVETLNPITLKDESNTWENIILESGYSMVYFDGLNKYYLESSQLHRKNFFHRVNILLTNYTPYQLLKERQQAIELQKELWTSQHKVIELEFIREKYYLILNSRLFRYTRTLRWVYSFFRFILSRNINSRSKLKRMSQFLKRYPRIRNFLISLYYALRRHKSRNKRKLWANSDRCQFVSNKIFQANRASILKSFRMQ